MSSIKLAFVVSVSCVLGFVFASSARGDEQAGGDALDQLPFQTQALIGPQVVLDEFFKVGVRGDYEAAGVGMRNLGGGTINISIPAESTISHAFLYWAIIRRTDRPAPNTGKLNGTIIRGTLVGTSGDPCWPFLDAGNFIDVYRANVSAFANNGVNTLSDFPSGLTDNTPPQSAPRAFPLLEGASLVVIFENSLFNVNTVIIRDGAQTLNRESVLTSFGNFTPVSGIGADEIAKTTYIVADGQARFPANQAKFDGTVVAGPTSGLKTLDAFDGADGIANVFGLDGLWDTLTVDVSSEFAPGVATSADAGVVAGTDGDCLTWVAQVLSVKTSLIPFEEIVSDSVDVASVGTGLTASFMPNFDLTLDDTAQIGGFDHFNWLNLIVQDDLLDSPLRFIIGNGLRDPNGEFPSVPYVDPPHGGYQYQVDNCGVSDFPVRDSLDWYWDEQFSFDCLEIGSFPATLSILDGVTFLKSLPFEDFPDSSFDIRFETYLVGVNSDGTGRIFGGLGTNFEWEYTGHLFAPGEVAVRDNIDPTLAGGGFSQLLGFMEPDDFTPEETLLFATLGIGIRGIELLMIDIQPGSDRNSINRKAMGAIPVALLSTEDFDVLTQVDEFSLTFGRTGDELSFRFCGEAEDVNDDGLLDLVCHFDAQTADFLPGDTGAFLRGETFNGIPIIGADSVRILH